MKVLHVFNICSIFSLFMMLALLLVDTQDGSVTKSSFQNSKSSSNMTLDNCVDNRSGLHFKYSVTISPLSSRSLQESEVNIDTQTITSNEFYDVDVQTGFMKSKLKNET